MNPIIAFALAMLLIFCSRGEVITIGAIVNNTVNLSPSDVPNCAEYQGDACSKCDGGFNLQDG